MITDSSQARPIDEGSSIQKPTATLSLLQQKYAPLIRMWNEHAERRRARRRAEKRVRDAERARLGRAKKKAAKALSAASLDALVTEAKNHRLALLKEAVQRPKGDKRLEQLVGREDDFATFWQARELARHQHGVAASDEQVANVYRGLSADSDFNRHKARSRRRIVRFLEEPGMPWDGTLLSLTIQAKARKPA
jgi:hypothetical protein